MVVINYLVAILFWDWHIVGVLQVIWKIITLQAINDWRESDFREDRQLTRDNLIEKAISSSAFFGPKAEIIYEIM